MGTSKKGIAEHADPRNAEPRPAPGRDERSRGVEKTPGGPARKDRLDQPGPRSDDDVSVPASGR